MNPEHPPIQPTRSTSLRPSTSSTTRSSNKTLFPTPTPSRSTPQSLEQLSQLKLDIEQQLQEKEQLHQTCESRIQKNVLARQIGQLQTKLVDLEQQSKQLQESPPDTADKLHHLERDLQSHRSQQRKDKPLYSQRGLDALPSPSSSNLLSAAGAIPSSSSSLLPLPPPPSGSTPTKRRSKVPNNDRRNTDIEFATEIGQGLLIEVRKMQAILQEKEEQLRALEIQKIDLERTAEALAKQLRQREENEEKLKEETWNLELSKQELTLSVTELQQHLHKATNEQTKLAQQTNDLRNDIEQLRGREEKLIASLEASKQRHEQDMSAMRRHCAGLQREAQQQAKHIDTLTSELAIAKAQSRLGKHQTATSNVSSQLSSGDSAAGVDPSSNATLDPTSIHHHHHHRSGSPTPLSSSPNQSPASAIEVETLKTSLAHAHRMVSNLRSNLHKEKTEKFEFKKLLAESQETIEQLQNDPHLWVDAPALNPSNQNGTLDDQKKRKAKQHRRATRRPPHRGGSSGGLGGNMATLAAVATARASAKSSRKHDIDSNNNSDDDFYSYSSASSSDDNDDETLPLPPPGFASLSMELSQSTAKLDNHASCDMGVMTDTNTIVLDGLHYEQQLNRLQQLERWYQVSLERPTQWTEANLVCINQDPVTSCETATQTHQVTPVEVALQTMTPEHIHQDCQCDLLTLGEETVETLAIAADASAVESPRLTNSDPSRMVDQGVQCDQNNKAQTVEMATQVDTISVNDASTQSDEHLSVDMAVQHEYTSVDQHTQSDRPTESRDIATQHEANGISKGVATQSEGNESMAMMTSTAIERPPTVDTGSTPITFDTLHGGSTDTALPTSSQAITLSHGKLLGEWIVDSRSTKDAHVQHSSMNTGTTTAATVAAAATALSSEKLEGNNYDWLGSFNNIGPLTSVAPLDQPTTSIMTPGNNDIDTPSYSQEEVDDIVAKAVEDATAAYKMASTIPARPTQPPPSALLDKATKSNSSFTIASTNTMDYANTLDVFLPRHSSLSGSSSVNINNIVSSQSTNSVHPAVIVSSSDIDQTRSTHDDDDDDDDDEDEGEGDTASVLPLPTTTADPTISSITQTMIGEWLTKYTRKHMGVQERQHQRYFWVHPYTRTLYWCTRAPGVGGGELKAKSAFVESIVVGNDVSPASDATAGVPCLYIQTLTRQLKIKAPTKERHDLWLESLMYLVNRSDQPPSMEPTPSIMPQRSVSASILRKTSFQRINELFHRNTSSMSIQDRHDHDDDHHSHYHDDDDDDDDALENVRMCCNGKHDVGRLEKPHHHHRPAYHQRNQRQASLDPSHHF